MSGNDATSTINHEMPYSHFVVYNNF